MSCFNHITDAVSHLQYLTCTNTGSLFHFFNIFSSITEKREWIYEKLKTKINSIYLILWLLRHLKIPAITLRTLIPPQWFIWSWKPIATCKFFSGQLQRQVFHNHSNSWCIRSSRHFVFGSINNLYNNSAGNKCNQLI